MSNINDARDIINKAMDEKNALDLTIKQERKRLKEAKENLRHSVKAAEIIQNVAKLVQEKTYEELTSIVSKCLQAIFNKPYEFKLEFIKRKGRTDAVFYYYRNGIRVDPMRCGGVTDIASLALRLAVLLLQRKRKFIWADEPFHFVDEERQNKIPKLLSVLVKELKIQMVITTHESVLKQGNYVVEVK